MNTKTVFRYAFDNDRFDVEAAVVVVVPDGISGKEDLLKCLAEILGFPDYFGLNWDALFECLRDLSWIETREVVIVHFGIPVLTDEDLKIYLKVLRDSVLDWIGDENHSLVVMFPEACRGEVEGILDGCV